MMNLNLTNNPGSNAEAKPDSKQVSKLQAEFMSHIALRAEKLFVWIMGLQFVGCVAIAIFISPRTWEGTRGVLHPHLIAAVVLGGLLAAGPIVMAFRSPGAPINKYVVSCSQLLFSSLLIHLTGGRIETHFHVFGSLAFLAFYRDWKVLIPGTVITAVDHFARAIFWPESIFGVLAPAPWRALEHAGWVIFTDMFLVYSCITSAREVRLIADRQMQLKQLNQSFEQTVRDRTQELRQTVIALNLEILDREKLEGKLLQSQKLESIGQLAAGIAHEINTPTQYVSDNTRFLQGEFANLLKVIEEYAAQLETEGEQLGWSERAEKIRRTLDELDFEFLKEEIPQAITQSLDGLGRISTIVKAMKEFSHPGAENKEPADLNNAISSTVTVCSNRWKYAADLELELDPDLGPVPCMVAEMNQVILNLVVNAADAIEEKNQGQDRKGNIKITTKRLDGHAEIRVADDGGGMPEKVKNKIFDPFFTTKEVGKGTGQGLAISRSVIVEKHGGTIDCETEAGVGTTFIITLPLEQFGSEESQSQEGAAA